MTPPELDEARRASLPPATSTPPDPPAPAPISSGLRAIVTLASVVVVIAALQSASGFFLPVLVALFIATVSTPVLAWLERARVPRVLAITLTVTLDMATLAILVALVASALSGFHEALPRYQRALSDLTDTLVLELRDHDVPISRDDLVTIADPAWMVRTAGDLITSLTQFASNALLVALLVVFMLFEIAPMRAKLTLLLDAPSRHVVGIAEAASEVQRYLVVKTFLSSVAGVLFGVILAIVGVDFALLWGLTAFLLNFIPTLGPAIATIPPVLIALLTLGPGSALAAAIGCLLVNLVVGNVLEPRMLGATLGVSTFVAFASMLFWGWLWGPIGALLAVPLTMLIRDALALEPSTRWLATLLASPEWVEARRAAWGWSEASRSASELPPGPPASSDAG